MRKPAEHPVVVGVSVLAGLTGILTYYHEYWTSPAPAAEASSAISQQQASPATAARDYKPDWWIVSAFGEKPAIGGFFVDQASMKPFGTMRRAWTLLRNGQPDSGGEVMVKNYSEYDCPGRSFREIETITEYSDGTVSANTAKDTSFRAVAPDSFGMDLFNFVCSGPQGQAHRIKRTNPEESVKAMNELL